MILRQRHVNAALGDMEDLGEKIGIATNIRGPGDKSVKERVRQ